VAVCLPGRWGKSVTWGGSPEKANHPGRVEGDDFSCGVIESGRKVNFRANPHLILRRTSLGERLNALIIVLVSDVWQIVISECYLWKKRH